MNETIYIVENVSVCWVFFFFFFFFFEKKETCINRRIKLTDGLSESTGIYRASQ